MSKPVLRPSVEGGMRGCNFGFIFDCTITKSMGNLQRGFDSLFPSPFPIGTPLEGEGQERGHKTSDHPITNNLPIVCYFPSLGKEGSCIVLSQYYPSKPDFSEGQKDSVGESLRDALLPQLLNTILIIVNTLKLQYI